MSFPVQCDTVRAIITTIMKSIWMSLILAFFMQTVASAAPRDDLWVKVQAAIDKGLPQTAITNLQPIIEGAMADKAYPEAVRALLKRITLEGQIQGNKPEEKIIRLQGELTNAPVEIKPMLEAVLAHWYLQYYQQNRWRFMQRSQTSAEPGTDFTTWDLPRLFAEISHHFEAALSSPESLRSSPIVQWDGFLIRGVMPDAWRPTLYDFLVHEAIGFYSAGEQWGIKPEGSFDFSATSPALGPVKEFMSWSPETADTNAPSMRALRLFQELLRFHQNDPAPRLAFAEADLSRFEWAWNTASGEEKNKRYKDALSNFIREYVDFDISAVAMYRQGQVLYDEGDWVGARELALRGANTFKDSPAGKMCLNLVGQIEARSLSIATERVWTPGTKEPASKIRITYRNLQKVHFRAIPVDWFEVTRRAHRNPANLPAKERRAFLERTPALSWDATLPATKDFKQRLFVVAAPASLKPGYYFIAASTDPEFGEKDNMVSMTDVWVSDLAIVTRARVGRMEGLVLDARSGEPISGAEVECWRQIFNSDTRERFETLRTDANGRFEVEEPTRRAVLIRVKHQGKELATGEDMWLGEPPQTTQPQGRIVFFTDRAIYRPGQTIQFKGICIWVDQNKDDYRTMRGEKVEVVFHDANGQEIAKQKLTSNDYGSVSGSFTAPRDRVMGAMSLQAHSLVGGVSFRVEEYKRPKFEVVLDAPKEGLKLGGQAKVKGHAMGYTGAAVDGAKVRYRVVREVRMPIWWGWYRSGPSWGGRSEEIVHGDLVTAQDGSFEVEFMAKPDPKIPEADSPIFTFRVHADVTDSAGETRSESRAISLGYAALEVTASLESWQTASKPVEVTVHTKTLDGEPLVAEGVAKLYSLKAPSKVQRARLGAEDEDEDGVADKDDSDPNSWPLDKVVVEKGFTSDTNGTAKLALNLKEGAYRLIVESQDAFGKKVQGQMPVRVLNSSASKLGIRIPNIVDASSWTREPGEEFRGVWGTGYGSGRALIEIEHRGKILQRYWTRSGRTQQEIRFPVAEEHRGGFYLHVTYVRENRMYSTSRKIEVPWTNKELEVRWEHFTSKLQPGQKETWTAVISGPKASKVTSEFVAGLYDASLDAFAYHSWMTRFDVFRQENSWLNNVFGNTERSFNYLLGQWAQPTSYAHLTPWTFPSEIVNNYWFGYPAKFGIGGRAYYGRFAESKMARGVSLMAAAPASMAADSVEVLRAGAAVLGDSSFALAKEEIVNGANEPAGGPKPDLNEVKARKNLNETAFFYPQLVADSNGVVRMSFTMPEALTRWRFMGFAHDQQARSGYLEGSAVTSKDLMVQPNPPRFLREGDMVEFTVKVSNQSETPQSGSVRLVFEEVLTGGITNAPADFKLGNTQPEQAFLLAAKASRSFSWRIKAPDNCGFLTYKAVAASKAVSDGEEGAVPVLSRRILVRESLPLPIRGPATKQFEFAHLLNSGKSDTLQHQNLVVQMVSNPAWYAVMALPYLIEFPHECSEQTFNRFYANSLARSIANSDPKIHKVFEQWRNTPALDSPLEKNEDLKSVALEETPWVRQAQSESQARRNVGILFEDNRLNYEMQRTLEKLTQMQLGDGRWPWFPGGRGNEYITLYIVTGFGRLRHLQVDVDVSAAIRALESLDAWIDDCYDDIQRRPNPEQYVPSPTDALYLYGRSFFLKDRPIAGGRQKAVDFYLQQARKFWVDTQNRQTQGHLALALHRFAAMKHASDDTPKAIMASLKERSVTNEEMGRFWRDTEHSWWWYRAPIETQALMIEAFDEVAGDLEAVEDCRVWLLKQKQTQDWKTTKATADAVYALLLRGRDILSSDTLVKVKVGELDLTPKPGTKVEAGTGFYEHRFQPSEIKPELGKVTVEKADKGVAWGAIHWAYLEDMAKVEPYEGTPLKLRKTCYRKVNKSTGPVIEPVNGPLEVGDELVTRVELRTDRDMEYIHLKDQRGSGVEPVNVLSQYRYQDGLAYYESTRDTASHFFIDYLPKGVYVFEYSSRVQLKGEYQTGIASIECMYAPEFNSHSESVALKVQ